MMAPGYFLREHREHELPGKGAPIAPDAGARISHSYTAFEMTPAAEIVLKARSIVSLQVISLTPADVRWA
jgi:hypothetical protein